MPWPADYLERVYAGVLGKIIGVYLGRPFEGWNYERIMAELGEITYYVNDSLKHPLIITDDDISGTFTFLRSLADYGYQRNLSAAQIGETWLNYLIEKRTVLWWGGLGNSTEHTAYLRLKKGIPAPRSGSIALNTKVVAEQIGAQIFIDGWAMVAPGDPEFAAALAKRAASVSHDGEAIYGAQVVAAMEAQAFVESDINALLDTGLTMIPRDSVIARMIHDIREWHAQDGDWRVTRKRIEELYGYSRYGGGCHMVPNHALIILSMLYGNDDFQRALMIANTSGWDTDCNSGNVGCLMGIKNGLAGLEAGPDWRGPIADRLFIPTADGGRSITDAVTETLHIVNTGRALQGEEHVRPKDGARFHFELPGAVQGFLPASSGLLSLRNVEGHSRLGKRSLALQYQHLAPGLVARAETATFIPPEYKGASWYGFYASPTLYPGQVVRAALSADQKNADAIDCGLYLRYYGKDDELCILSAPVVSLQAGEEHVFEWRIPDLQGAPVAFIGVALQAERRRDGIVYLDYLTWDGTPEVSLLRGGGEMWRRAWVDGVDHFEVWSDQYRLTQDEGRGLVIQGTREWTDYRVSALIQPHLMVCAGIAARVQGMRRYYGLFLFADGYVRLIKALEGDHVLAEKPFSLSQDHPYLLTLQVSGNQLQCWLDDEPFFNVQDAEHPLTGGALALVCEEGRVSFDQVEVRPLQ